MSAETRELLELAAKAAGYVPASQSCDDCEMVIFDGDEPRHWNPRDDNGDAIRLKVALYLVVGSYGNYSSASGTFGPGGYRVGGESVAWHSETGGDPIAAERLAIVRAAAAIGRAIP